MVGEISIHAPRAGGDHKLCQAGGRVSHFNPRPPCGGRRMTGVPSARALPRFQSTPPVRGATQRLRIHRRGNDFNPRPPCGGRPPIHIILSVSRPISIHAPRAGGDHNGKRYTTHHTDFNPRPPCGGRQINFKYSVGAYMISIHAPRAGSDARVETHGKRGSISIHAPRAGSDNGDNGRMGAAPYFNPRSPCGERRAAYSGRKQADSISIHAPRAGSDRPHLIY